VKKIFASLSFLIAFYSPSSFAQKISIVTEDIPVYSFYDEKLQAASGLTVEIVSEVMKRAKLDYRINIYPWARAYKIAQEMPNTAIFALVRKEEREKHFKWVGVIYDNDAYLYKLKSRTDLKAKNMTELHGYTIGVVRDGAAADVFLKEGLHIDAAPASVNNVHKLLLQRIDAMMGEELSLNYLLQKNNIDPGLIEKMFRVDKLSGQLYLAFSLQTSDTIVDACKTALASMMQDGSFQRITQKWRSKQISSQ